MSGKVLKGRGGGGFWLPKTAIHNVTPCPKHLLKIAFSVNLFEALCLTARSVPDLWSLRSRAVTFAQKNQEMGFLCRVSRLTLYEGFRGLGVELLESQGANCVVLWPPYKDTVWPVLVRAALGHIPIDGDPEVSLLAW